MCSASELWHTSVSLGEREMLWEYEPAGKYFHTFFQFSSFSQVFLFNNWIMSSRFYEMIVDEAEGQISYHPIEIESEKPNCFSTILAKVRSNNSFQLFLDVLLNCAP